MSRSPDPAPLPYDGVLTVTIGTGLWLIALIVLAAVLVAAATTTVTCGGSPPRPIGFGLGVVGDLVLPAPIRVGCGGQGRNVGEG